MDINQEPESLSQSLMRSVANDYMSSSLIEFGESLLDDATDSVLNSDIATKIPVIGTFVAIGKGILNFRDRRYASKLVNFLAVTSKASWEDKEKYRNKLDARPSECNKAGETLLDILEKITSIEKAGMVGKVFLAFMHEDAMTTDHVITLSEMIEKAYLSDLLALSKISEISIGQWDDTHLESVGIKKPMRVEDVNKAINAAMARMLKQMPVIREGPINDTEEPQVIESGFTEMGDILIRILRTY